MGGEKRGAFLERKLSPYKIKIKKNLKNPHKCCQGGSSIQFHILAKASLTVCLFVLVGFWLGFFSVLTTKQRTRNAERQCTARKKWCKEEGFRITWNYRNL